MSDIMRPMGTKTGREKPTPAHVKFDLEAFFSATNARLVRDGFQPIRWVRFNVVQGCYVVCEVAAQARGRITLFRGDRKRIAAKQILPGTVWRGVGVARASAEDRRHNWSQAYGKILSAQRAVRNYRERRDRNAQPEAIDLEFKPQVTPVITRPGDIKVEVNAPFTERDLRSVQYRGAP